MIRPDGGSRVKSLFEIVDHTMVLTLNRPEVMNAVNGAVTVGVADALERAKKDPDVWTFVITGNGRSFCAGQDLKASARGDAPAPPEYRQWGWGGYARHFIPKPTIAAVNGFALGGGTALVLASDLAVAVE